MKEKIEELIKEAEQHSFINNSYNSQYGTYTIAGMEMQSWIAECENFISINYGHKSAPWKIFERYDLRVLNGYEQQDLDREKTIIVSALAACLRITPKEYKKQIATKELD